MGEGENDWADKAEEERLGILAKYDKGREEGAQIDSWEDPGYEIYHVTDHYGFIHDTRFPDKFNPEENRRREIEAERADKWIKMHINWDKYKGSEKLRKRTFKGVPNKVRGLFWSIFLDLPTIKEQQRGKYEEMYNMARKHSLDVRQIDLDVNRTYRDNVMFRERYCVKQRSLFNILCAYSVYNSEVGYCQGMSQVAALLLVYMDEEDAFWGLSQLMTHHKYGMHGFFIAGFPKLIRFQKHHDKVLKTMMPKLKKHLDKHGIDVGLYTLKWFFQCFLDRVPFELALRLWDIFLMDGDKVLICGAYSILKIHQKQLLAKKSMDDLLDYIQSKIPSDLNLDNDKAIETYQRCMDDLHRKKLDTAGDPTEEELPKKPFGLIENIVKPVPVRKEPLKIKKEIATKQDDKPQTISSEVEKSRHDEEEEFDDISEKASASRVSATVTSAASSSVANSPHNFSRPLSSVSNFSYASAIEEYNNASSKSTPLKMNGVSSTKHKSADQCDLKNQASNESGKHNINKKDEPTENGSVETVSSMEFIQSQTVVNIIGSIKETRVEREERSNSFQKDSQFSPEKATKNPKPPPPPARSFEINYIPKTIPNTFPVSDSISSGGSIAEPSRRSNFECSINSEISPKKVSPPKSPRIPGSSSVTLTDVSSVSHWPSSSINIPGGETVRIHVPYSNSSTQHDISNVPAKTTAGVSRTNFDVLKNDPNRIKIDISSK